MNKAQRKRREKARRHQASKKKAPEKGLTRADMVALANSRVKSKKLNARQWQRAASICRQKELMPAETITMLCKHGTTDVKEAA